MADPLLRFRRFLAELKRRNVYRVTVAYLVVAFVVLQLADLAAGALPLPTWLEPTAWVLCGLGFPIALVLAWAFDLTPEGVRRTPPPEETGGTGVPGSRDVAYVLAALAVVVGGTTWWVVAGRAAHGGPQPMNDPLATRGLSAAPRVAILPFESISPSSGNDFFARGIHEEVIGQLGKISGLKVISRTSVLRYEGRDRASVQEISEDLGGVAALLEGTVRRAGDQLRIAVNLIDAESDTQLWSKTYDREHSVEEVFDIQADIASQIAAALETRLTPAEKSRIEGSPTTSIEAYEAYLQGRSAWWDVMLTYRNFGLLDRAIERLQMAVRLDPEFSEAWAWLATAYKSRHSVSERSVWLDSARVALDRARQPDSHSAAVAAAEGMIAGGLRDAQRAIGAFEEALELQPSNSLAVIGLAIIRSEGERWRQAFRWAHRALEVSPRHPTPWEVGGGSLMAAGLMSEAEAWYRRALELEPGTWRAKKALVHLEEQRGNSGLARQKLETFLEDAPGHPELLALAGQMALWAGDPARAGEHVERALEERRRRYPQDSPTRPERVTLGADERALLGLAEVRLGNADRGRALLEQAAEELRPSRHVPRGRVLLGSVLLALDRPDDALGSLERAVEEGFSKVWRLETPLFDGIRSDPRFHRIVRQAEENRTELAADLRAMDLPLRPPGG